eukprot:CAMPEP_0172515174 /NCGR_PEP_ID=MMETSP1066-20121228/265935_1 /TAXON_ID=671091 /ORGANISM="Coscinodiscus wailesii, Strain CCMP2513" /LENGTH=38 /DNA_ID= /DNA_START= /DNA_END= /DNA_ORIENTATION=
MVTGVNLRQKVGGKIVMPVRYDESDVVLNILPGQKSLR